MKPLFIIIVVVVLLILYIISTYNKLVKKRLDVDEAFATMDVYLKKRWDMIPNLVETVKGYAKHEADTLMNVISARNGAYSNMSESEKLETNTILSNTIPKIFALSEAYPDLKASQNFMTLSTQLEKVEQDIANARKYYNAVVKNFNLLIDMFPSSIIAGMFHFTKREMFNIDEASRENVEVKF